MRGKPGLLFVVSAALAAAADPVFERRIAPLFAAQCAECHSEKTRTSGFSVGNLQSVLEGGNKHGAAVVAGHPERSPLVKLLKGQLAPQMPLGKTLAATDLALIEGWIRDLRAPTPAPNEWSWPFRKPVQHEPPAVIDKQWVRNPIDAFVLAKLEQHGLGPAEPASKRTLARRVFLDLAGMPPTPDEMQAFLADPSPDAYEKLIDRLLADPRYGERWGRHWLDLVRYAETSGLEGDGAIGNAWRYRDWVIQAFNANLPYDRFVMLQIAGGDEHSKTRNNYQPDPQGVIPTGFLRLAPWDRSNLVAAEVRANYLAEVTGATASIFLGLTAGCARCHDHKYDPISTRDFYRLQAFFNATQADRAVEVPYKEKGFAAKALAKVKEYEERLKNGPEKRALEELEQQLLKKLIAGRAERARGRELGKEDLRLELRLQPKRIFSVAEQERHADFLADAQRTQDPDENQALEAFEKQLLKKLAAAYARPDIDPLARFQALTAEDVRAEAAAQYSARQVLSEEDKARHGELSGKLDVFRRRLSRWQPQVLAVTNVPGPPSGPEPAPTRILVRGDYRQPGDVVEPGFLSAITGHSQPAVLETDRYRQFITRGWRMTLARWIASPENPLTARVMVNRIWQQHFGAGIVRTASDFGRNGERPTHPELLDWLAVRFIEEGWDIKGMHRLMLLSNTYRQAADHPDARGAEKDPDNRLLWRFHRRRLEAEAIRDSILAASGRLNGEMGGPSVFPPLPEDLADFARYGRTGGLMWEPNENEEDARRRSVYIFQRRSLPLPLMAAFDALPFSESCERRSSTTTPLQALALMNGALVHEEAAHLANRIEAQTGRDHRAAIARAFEIVLSRPPRDGELEKFLRFDGPLEAICRVLFNSNEFLYVE